MHLNNEHLLKTLGPLAARLVATLYQHNRPIFHFKEAEDILNGRAPATKVLAQLINHGVVVRLKPGSFRLVPFELGFEREYLGNPYVVAKELAVLANKEADNAYYLSHGSAFDLHQMATQPQLVVYVSSPKMIRSLTIQGTEFKFVRCKPQHLFGLTHMWMDKTEKVCVSDLERTLLDGLKQPAYCGGFSEVAKGFCIKHQSIDTHKLIGYAIKLNVGVVIRRLGYLMEIYQIGEPSQWEFLRSKITSTYLLLDPELPADGRHIAKWRLKLNIPEAELLAIGGT
jgi:predicted transcriptional regulator of viral defense system